MALADADYWDQRYTLDSEPFEWYLSYSTSKEYREALSLLRQAVTPALRQSFEISDDLVLPTGSTTSY